MAGEYTNEAILDIYIFETSQLIAQMEQLVLANEKNSCYTSDAVNEIFRIMHTIKGSSAMMLFNDISNLAHVIEDLFFYLREEKPLNIDCSILNDLVFEGIDFIKLELEKIRNGDPADGNAKGAIARFHAYIGELKSSNPISAAKGEDKPKQGGEQNYYASQASMDDTGCKNSYRAVIHFEDGCEMENIRAYTVVHNLRSLSAQIKHIPEDLIENDESAKVIRERGFQIYLRTDSTYEEVNEFLRRTLFLKELELAAVDGTEDLFEQQQVQPQKMIAQGGSAAQDNKGMAGESHGAQPQGLISVAVSKLDKLMDLVGEMVIAEAMVTQNPDLRGLELENFHKASRQLRKITGELQDTVMSIRMVPLSTTFHKMHRIARDMGRKLGKAVMLDIIGEETEVDKNIIERISDPIMHLVRNSIDHGLETKEERLSKGKAAEGTVTLEAKNAGNDVVIMVRDDGQGLDRYKIIAKAKQNNLLVKSESELSEKEIYNLIFLPGFSTKDEVTEFSGRGVGMDVVSQNIIAVGGSIAIDSKKGFGTSITIKIPLTLAIVDGMNIRVGKSCYTIPTIAIKESFRPKETDIICDPDGNEIIMVRGQCYPVVRLHQLYKVKGAQTLFHEGILVMVENDGEAACIFADELIGEQQVVVKALPAYIKEVKNIKGLSGCTLLGDGSISLILDVGSLINN